MAELLKARKGLRKAGDANHDPADIPSASKTDAGTDSAPAHDHASDAAGQSESPSVSVSARDKARRDAGDTTSADARQTADVIDIKVDSGKASETTGGSADQKASRAARSNASQSVFVNASRKAGSKARKTAGGKTRRRRGRPPGPTRVATTVRILDDLDQALTEACDTSGLGPQDIIDAALAEWLMRHDRLAEDDSDDVQDVLRRVRRRTTPN